MELPVNFHQNRKWNTALMLFGFEPQQETLKPPQNKNTEKY